MLAPKETVPEMFPPPCTVRLKGWVAVRFPETAFRVRLWLPGGVEGWVERVSVALTGDPPGTFTAWGLMLTPAGARSRLRRTAPAKPPRGVRVRDRLALSPARRLTWAGDRARVKPGSSEGGGLPCSWQEVRESPKRRAIR